MDVYLETRGSGRTTGYRFLGAAPSAAWWRSYGDRTSFDYSTVLVESAPGAVRVYLGAVPSNRHDTEGATNRVTIVIESPPLADDEQRRLITRLVAAWVTDIGTGGDSLQRALDAEFDESTVARLYAASDASDEVRERVLKTAHRLNWAPVAAAQDVPPSWLAPTHSARGRAAFVERVDALLAGTRTGVAALVNLASGGSAFAAEAAAGVAVLVDDPSREVPDALAPIVDEPAAPPIVGRVGPGKALAVLGGTARRMGCAALVLLVVVVIVAVAVRARSAIDAGSPRPPTRVPTANPTTTASTTTPTAPTAPTAVSPAPQAPPPNGKANRPTS